MQVLCSLRGLAVHSTSKFQFEMLSLVLQVEITFPQYNIAINVSKCWWGKAYSSILNCQNILSLKSVLNTTLPYIPEKLRNLPTNLGQ